MIRQNDLLEQPQRQQDEAPAQLTTVRTFRLETLRQELGSTNNRTGDQLRKERHEERVVEERRRGAHPPPVDVDRIRQRLERVEADPDRQHDPRRGGVEHDADPTSELRKGLQQQGGVLEVGQDAEIRRQAEQEPCAARGASAGVDTLAGNPVDHGRHDEQADEWRVPGRVEHVARAEQHALLGSPREGQLIERQHHQEEQREGETIEGQGAGLSLLIDDDKSPAEARPVGTRATDGRLLVRAPSLTESRVIPSRRRRHVAANVDSPAAGPE